MNTIARLPFERAFLLRGRLEAEGIRSEVLDECTNAGIPLTGDPSAGFRVQVSDEDTERALEVIRELIGEGAE